MPLPPYTHNMFQTATYWAPLGNDGFGGEGFVAPVTILCRWQNTTQLFVGADGREYQSSAIVYPDQELALRGYLAEGDQTGTPDPQNLDEAYEIRQTQISPALDAQYALNKVFL